MGKNKEPQSLSNSFSAMEKIFETLKYRPGQEVLIVPLDKPGTVVGITINHYGLVYEIRWFQDAGFTSSMFFESELSAVATPSKKKFGFHSEGN